MIDRGDIRQAIDRCSNIWASLPGAGYGQFEHKADSLIAKIQRSGPERSERLMYEQSHRDYLPLWLSASSSACHGLLIITVITPLPTKPSATKMPENWSWRTRQLLTCRCVSVMLLRSMQNTWKRLARYSWKWCSAWWCCRWSSRLHIKAVCQSVREATTASGVDNAASPTGRHRWTGLFHPQRGWSLCKNNWKEPRSILMSSADGLPISMERSASVWAIHTRFQRSINA